MRLIFALLLVACLAAAAPLLIEKNPTKTLAKAKEPPIPDDKKPDDPKTESKKTELKKPENPDEEILRRAKLPTDAKSLTPFLRKRILLEKDRAAIEKLIRQLGSSDYRTREQAMQSLIGHGVSALEVLRQMPRGSVDFEVVRRIERSIQTIHEKDVGPEVTAAVIRVLADSDEADLVETLIGYAPFADNDAVLEELRAALGKHALKDGKADPALVAALTDRSAVRRAFAGEALARTALAENKDALKKLLRDDDALVRYRVARSMALAKERDAIPALIDTIPDLPINTAWQAEDFLLKLTTVATAPTVAMSNDKPAREKCKAAWQQWWKKHGEKADLAKLTDNPKQLGRTLVILLDQDMILELGPDNQPRWQFRIPQGFPLDAQIIGDDRVLVAEHHANRISERDFRGEIIRQKLNVFGPQLAQRLANGNTFVATAVQLLEYDKDDQIVLNVNLSPSGQQEIMKALKLDNGEIVCMLADSRIVRYDNRGNEIQSFKIPLNTRLFGGRIHMLPTGRVIVPHYAENKVVEYDTKGNIVWEAPFESPVVATRLPNGNTLVTSMNADVGAVEIDRTGAAVWSYQARGSRVTRAIRR